MSEENPLTVNKMLEILTELKEKGHGDKSIAVEYEDSGNITSPLSKYEINEQYKYVIFEGYD